MINVRHPLADFAEIPNLEQLNLGDDDGPAMNNTTRRSYADLRMVGRPFIQVQEDFETEEEESVVQFDETNNNNTNNNLFSFNDRDLPRRRTMDERALLPSTYIGLLENSLIQHIQPSVVSPDELVIRQRGRKKTPAKISWSPMKTPTKKSSAHHMSLLSPSPKKLFGSGGSTHSSSMILRSSPRKRILTDTPNDSSTPLSTPTKRLRFNDDRPMNATNTEIPMKTLLMGLSQEQLISIICNLTTNNPVAEQEIRLNLPLPDVRPFEEQLCSLRKNVTKSSPRSRLLSKTDSIAYSRASSHLAAFKK